MSQSPQDELLAYYREELTYLRRMGGLFARQYPRVAGRLERGADASGDPHVERLLESFAFLTARIRRTIDAALPEISSELLQVLHPQFVQPVPSMSVARFAPDPEQGKLTTGYLVPRDTALVATTAGGLPVRFRTCYDTVLWPLEVAYAGFESTDQFDFPELADVATVLRIRLVSRGAPFSELALDRLRFYLAGDSRVVATLYDLLAGHVRRVAVLPDRLSTPIFLPEDAVAPVGFAEDEAVLPHPAHAQPGYRLLQEYFTFSPKFSFVDVQHLDARAADRTIDLLVLLDRHPGDRFQVSAENLQLGCTPIVNLFRKTCEPVRVDQRHAEYRVVGDSRRERSTEIHSILKVSAVADPLDEATVFRPYYAFDHEPPANGDDAFWHARRVPTGRDDVPGTDVMMSFHEPTFAPATPMTRTVYVHALCTNRRLAEQLLPGTPLQLERPGIDAEVVCLHKPTPQIEPAVDGETQWRLVSHLSLNHLSLAGGEDGLRAFREILRLHCLSDRPSTQRQITGIKSLDVRHVVRRVGGDAWRGFVRGEEITLRLDEEAFVGGSALLFATVLQHFLAQYVSINSFTQLRITSDRREGTWKLWPPVSGTQPVV